MIRLPADAETALRVLEDAGYEAFAVGGCVRDLLRGKPVHDIDIATNAVPDQIETAFLSCGYRTIPTGKRHGTITALIGESPVEVTTYRVDGSYIDARHPEQVRFAGRIEDDLARRDFTINAMAFHSGRGLIDLFGGREDLKKGLIRTVGEGRIRFNEDALRILRAFRFQAQLGFELTEDCLASAQLCADLLRRISIERVTAELSRLLPGPNADRALAQMRETGVLDWILPDREGGRLGPAPPNLPVRLALVFAPLDWGEAQLRLHALRLPNAVLHDTFRLLLAKELAIPADLPEVKRLFREWEDGIDLLFDFLRLWRPAEAEAAERARRLTEAVQADGSCYKFSMLAMKGGDLTALGLRGPAVGEALGLLLEAVISGQVENDRKALMELLKFLDLQK